MATAKKSATKPATAKTSASRKTSAKKSAKTSGSQTCWPGFQHVPGTKAGAKGSCEPKARQSQGEKKADSKAAAASKREKGDG